MMSSEIEQYVDILRGIKVAIEHDEEQLANLRRHYDSILTDDIPALLHEHGLSSVKMSDGTEVGLQMVYTVKVKDKLKLVEYLEETGNDAIVKMEYDFPKGTNLLDVDAYLADLGIDYTKEITVHHMSLKKAIKEHLESGGDRPPEEAAEVNVYERAKVGGL
jgi:hypothetical protein